jgi:hypothetical protein
MKKFLLIAVLALVSTGVWGQADFRINAGFSDVWYDPVTSGQGFYIAVFPVIGKVSLAWFTYDTELPPVDAEANLGDPGHRWLTALGTIDGNQVVMEITLTSGGIFDYPTDVQRTDPPGSDGYIWLTFDDCNSGTVEYDIPSIQRQGIVPIQRITNDNVALCEMLMEEVSPSQADLAVTILDAADGTYESGDTLNIDNKTENLGGTTSETYRLNFYLSTDRTISASDYSLGYVDRPALSAGENHYHTNYGPIPNSIPAGQYYVGALITTTNDSNSSNNSKYDPTRITLSSASPTNAVEGRWTGSITISGGGQSCSWSLAGIADANTSTTGSLALTSTLRYDRAPNIECISDYAEANYSISGNNVRVQLTYMANGEPIGDGIYNYVFDGPNRLVLDETELWEGVWITTTSTLVKD